MDYFWTFVQDGERHIASTLSRLYGVGRPVGQHIIRDAILEECPRLEGLYFLGAAHPADADALLAAAQAGRVEDAATFRVERDRIAAQRMIAAFRQEAARIDAWVVAG